MKANSIDLESDDPFWIEGDRDISSCDSQLSLGWSSAGGTDVS